MKAGQAARAHIEAALASDDAAVRVRAREVVAALDELDGRVPDRERAENASIKAR